MRDINAFCKICEALNSTDLEPIVRLWLLRLMIPMGIAKRFLRGVARSSEIQQSSEGNILDTVDFYIDDDEDEWDTSYEEKLERCISRNKVYRRNLLDYLHRLYDTEEKTSKNIQAPMPLGGNVKCLSKLARLSPTDCRLLEFAVLLHADDTLEEACNLLGDLNWKQTLKALSNLLDLPQADIHKALSKESRLAKTSLLTVDKGRRGYRPSGIELKNRLDLISTHFIDTMMSSHADALRLLQDRVSASTAPHLSIEDFGHKEKEIDILLPYLKQSLQTRRRGVNVLLYGAPGTGKSQLARVLAKEAGCQLFEVASEDKNGDAPDCQDRLRAFHAAQALLSGRKIIILFEEIEDIFGGGDSSIAQMFGLRRAHSRHNSKAWLNQRLEENQAPTLWISNSIDEIDPAFKRRFDLIVSMPVPPQRQRQKIIQSSCCDILGERDIERIARAESLAPAVVTRAASVVTTIAGELTQSDPAAVLELIINNTLEAQGHQRIQRHDPNQLPETYDPAFVHTDTDIEALVCGLKQSTSGRLCLYGPPGTGKTAYARWMAEQLETPLLVRRGSDLLSMWVGGTEKKIAESFRQAEAEGAILLIDEIEGFLQDRRGAQRRWEVTGVNEMLTQMESFPGILMASTNLMERLDQAALRRFDVKIKFDCLVPKQSQALLTRYCKALHLDTPDRTLLDHLTRLDQLTPGDFAAVARRHRFSPINSAGEMVTALEKECSHKMKNTNSSLGFF